MDGPPVGVDAYRSLKMTGLCICILAAALGVISLVAGLHRVSLTQACASAAAVCILANSLWPSRSWQIGLVALSIATLACFFVGVGR